MSFVAFMTKWAQWATNIQLKLPRKLLVEFKPVPVNATPTIAAEGKGDTSVQSSAEP